MGQTISNLKKRKYIQQNPNLIRILENDFDFSVDFIASQLYRQQKIDKYQHVQQLEIQKAKSICLQNICIFPNLQKLLIQHAHSVNLNYPLQFIQLSNLTTLHLNNSNLTSLSGIQTLQYLTVLSAHKVKNLLSLRTLDLNNNKIRSLKHISNLIQLRTFSVSHNNIVNCEELFHFAHLQNLISYNVSDNPFIINKTEYELLINYARNRFYKPESSENLTAEHRQEIDRVFKRFEGREKYGLILEKRRMIRKEVEKKREIVQKSQQKVREILSRKQKLYEMIQDV